MASTKVGYEFNKSITAPTKKSTQSNFYINLNDRHFELNYSNNVSQEISLKSVNDVTFLTDVNLKTSN